MRRVDADGEAGLAAEHGDVGEIDEVPVGLAEVGLHAAQAEDDVGVALAGDVLAGVERLFEGDAHAALEEDGEALLLADVLEELEVLGVARADLEHDAGGAAGVVERGGDLVDVAGVGDFHGDDADAVAAGEIEEPGEAGLAEALEIVGAGARFVDAHARGHLALIAEGGEHELDVLAGVDGAEAGEEVDALVVELDAVVREAGRLGGGVGAADEAVFDRDADDLAHPREGFEWIGRHRARRAEEVNLDHRGRGAAKLVAAGAEAGEALGDAHHGFSDRLRRVGLEGDDHGAFSLVEADVGWLSDAASPSLWRRREKRRMA